MKIVTNAEMRAIDRSTSERFGVPSLTLMENAGTAVADFVVSQYPDAKRIAVVCGRGNNGGDGFVAARKLHDLGREVSVVLAGDRHEVRGDAAVMLAKLPVEAFSIRSSKELEDESVTTSLRADLLVDALLGSGIRLPVIGLYAEVIAAINACGCQVVSVDVPSGVDADLMTPQTGLVVRANAIVTFTAPRPAHVYSALTNGPTVIAPIGSPPQVIISSQKLNVIAAVDVAPMIAPRRSDSNKGSYGHVLVVGGAVGKAGSAAMAGFAVLRAGAGLATVATAKSAMPTVAGFHPELMTEPLPETVAGTISDDASARLDEILKGKTAVAIGPGISRNHDTAKFVCKLVATCKNVPIVLDADGLNAFEGRADELSGKDRALVITPHPGEMARLAGCTTADVQRDRLGVARKFAAEHHLIVVLKGHRTVVAQPDGEAWINLTGNPGMATGGTGDILTGMIAGIIAQHPGDVLNATLAAVYLHGLAGDVVREQVGEHSMVATDLLTGLPEAFRRALKAAMDGVCRW